MRGFPCHQRLRWSRAHTHILLIKSFLLTHPHHPHAPPPKCGKLSITRTAASCSNSMLCARDRGWVLRVAERSHHSTLSPWCVDAPFSNPQHNIRSSNRASTVAVLTCRVTPGHQLDLQTTAYFVGYMAAPRMCTNVRIHTHIIDILAHTSS